MTQREYQRLYRSANNKTTAVTQSVRQEVLKAYTTAGNRAAAAVRQAEEAGLSDLTSAAWRQINEQLQVGADIISRSMEENVPAGINASYRNYALADEGYISDAIEASGTTLISDAGVRNISLAINNQLVERLASQLYEDGFTFSDRVWRIFDNAGFPIGVNGDYQYRIKNIVLAGVAQGRDAVDIAKDIQVYIADGKNAVFATGRYGKLVPGTGEYTRRISGTVDWRALRIIRSELHSAMQAAGVADGVANPACMNLFDWKKTAGNPIDPDGSRNASGLRCIDLEDSNPYALENVPGYQHPSCSCSVIPVLMDQRQFVEDLKNWRIGEGNVPYLDAWYRNTYLPAQNGALTL